MIENYFQQHYYFLILNFQRLNYKPFISILYK